MFYLVKIICFSKEPTEFVATIIPILRVWNLGYREGKKLAEACTVFKCGRWAVQQQNLWPEPQHCLTSEYHKYPDTYFRFCTSHTFSLDFDKGTGNRSRKILPVAPHPLFSFSRECGGNNNVVVNHNYKIEFLRQWIKLLVSKLYFRIPLIDRISAAVLGNQLPS